MNRNEALVACTAIAAATVLIVADHPGWVIAVLFSLFFLT